MVLRGSVAAIMAPSASSPPKAAIVAIWWLSLSWVVGQPRRRRGCPPERTRLMRSRRMRSRRPVGADGRARLTAGFSRLFQSWQLLKAPTRTMTSRPTRSPTRRRRHRGLAASAPSAKITYVDSQGTVTHTVIAAPGGARSKQWSGGCQGGQSGGERLHRSVGLGHHRRGERGGGAVLGRDHGLEEHGEVALVGRRRVPVRRRRRRGIIRPVRDDAVAFLAVYCVVRRYN